MNKKLFLTCCILTAALLCSLPVDAGKIIPMSEQGIEHSKAAEHSPVIDLIENTPVLAPPGLERIVFIHYDKQHMKAGVGSGGKNQLYSLMGPKWKTLPVNIVIDTDNADGLAADFIINAITLGAGEWDSFTGASLFGSYSLDANASWDSSTPDGRNEIVFGNYPQTGVIGITIIWGYFSGSPSARRITEFDILLDTDFAWGDASADASVMDVQNIITHELGHGLGLNDLYTTKSVEQTMYGYSTEGETKKRSLNTGDAAGIRAMYGN